MDNFYKGKYLIAIYDKEDNLLDVGWNIRDLNKKNYSFCALNKEVKRRRKRMKPQRYVLHLIDVTEKHNDIFREEDREFLKFWQRTKRKSEREKREELCK